MKFVQAEMQSFTVVVEILKVRNQKYIVFTSVSTESWLLALSVPSQFIHLNLHVKKTQIGAQIYD